MFSLQLKELRLRNRLSQKELAQILNVSTGTVGNWEVGTREPDFNTAIKIADFFNVSLDYLLRGKECHRGDALTPCEEELLAAFRRTRETMGDRGQRALLSVAEIFGNR